MPPPDHPRTGPRHEPERIHERAPDPAEAANRPLEPRPSNEPLAATDEPQGDRPPDPHHSLNRPAGEPDPEADSDPYPPEGGPEEADRASGVRGSGQGAERR